MKIYVCCFKMSSKRHMGKGINVQIHLLPSFHCKGKPASRKLTGNEISFKHFLNKEANALAYFMSSDQSNRQKPHGLALPFTGSIAADLAFMDADDKCKQPRNGTQGERL